ncbi:abc transporter [Colletotrichum incanum]|uniref:Abc transporter n=1 Tax=Colletotrichum incanum TaxID=1573173 RepID=A0A162N5I6_COLIC|nr:abc transporter [Colletotrichum incanum]
MDPPVVAQSLRTSHDYSLPISMMSPWVNRQAVFGAYGCSNETSLESTRCARNVDFNFGLEEAVFSIIPCSVAIIWGIQRCNQLWKRPVVAQGSVLLTRYLISCIILSVLLLLTLPFSIAIAPVSAILLSGFFGYCQPRRQIASPQNSHLFTRKLSLWHALLAFQVAGLISLIWIAVTGSPRHELDISIASWALSVTSSLLLSFVSKLEHNRSLAPSALLQTFLLVTIALDAGRIRSAWFARGIYGESQLLPIQLFIKVFLLFAESRSKAAVLSIPARQVSREEVSGIFGKSLALWINPLLSLGWKNNLTVDDLEPVDESLSGEKVLDRLSSAWQKLNQDRSHALAVAVLRTFWPEIVIVHIPRLVMVGFALVQPLLVQATIKYIQDHEGRPASYGHWLIAAYTVTYLGLAISTQWCGQLVNRLVTRLRGALIAIIYQNMLSLRAETGNSEAAVSLMSTEVERITVTAQYSLSIIPDLIQLGFALWILSSQLGGVSVAPVIIAILCVSAGVKVGQLVPPRQRRWMQAIQKRVGLITEIIGSVKGVKMSGLSATVQHQIQGLREFEIEESKRFRRMQFVNIIVGQFPSIMTPSITFTAFAIVQKLSNGEPLNVVQAFTSLSLLGILINPVTELVMIPNNLGSAIGCLDRIQEFLMKEKREDYRQIKLQTQNPAQMNGTSEAPAEPRPLIRVSKASFGWHSTQPVLSDLELEVLPSTLTMLVGPVGSGKSTLLKSLVGETYRISGNVEYTTNIDVAYCDQDPWILNQSIKDNIFGGVEYNPVLYRKVIEACQLDQDLSLLPQGDETLVGSSGAALSGGQKHRIALARAVYSGKQVIIMDDNLKGLDSATASKCFNALFGTDGLLRGQSQAVLFATHNAQWLRFADNIIALGSDGTISERGSYEELSKSGGYVSTLQVSQQGSHGEDKPSEEPPKENGKQKDKTASSAAPDTTKTPNARSAANTSSLLYYIKSMGISSFALFFAMVLFQTSCRTIQRLWVKFWVAANESGGQENWGMWAGFWFFIVVVPHSAKGLHFSVLKAAFAAPLSFFVKTDTGVIINRFSQDMNLVDLPLPIAFILTCDALALTIADIILTCTATGYLAFAIPVLAAVLFTIQSIYLQTSRQVRLLDLETKSPIFSHFIASFSGLVTIRALGWTDKVHAENLERLDLSQRAFYIMGSLQKWLLLVLNLTVTALAVLLVGLSVALQDTIDPGLLGVALVSVMGFGQLLTGLLNNWAMLETCLGAVARIREFETETPSENDGNTPVAVEGWPPKGQIDITDVSAAYDDYQVLSSINLSIKAGEKVAICGRTGSGKSTLLSLLLRLHDPSTGAIEVDGVDISTMPINQLRKSLVALPQDTLFLPGTVRQNLDPFASRDDAAIWSALEKTGLKNLFEDKGGLESDLNTDWLSAGQKQLFCMARAILRDSRVLLLDEATSSLDQATEKVVQDLIRSKFQGWTVVVIAHRLKQVADFDKIVTLQDGQVVEFDHPKTLLEKGGVFASMWKLQEG